MPVALLTLQRVIVPISNLSDGRKAIFRNIVGSSSDAPDIMYSDPNIKSPLI